MGLTKPEIDKNYSFFTLTTEEARDNVLNDGLAYNQEKLQVSITRDQGAGNPLALRISTTLVANNLPQRETQTTISRVIKQTFGTDNIIGISFATTTNPTPTSKQVGATSNASTLRSTRSSFTNSPTFSDDASTSFHTAGASMARIPTDGDPASTSIRERGNSGQNPSHEQCNELQPTPHQKISYQNCQP